MLTARDKYGIEGVSFLGGEPFAHAVSCAALTRLLSDELSVMIFSGYTLEEIRALPGQDATGADGVRDLLEACDLLVDGRNDRDLPDHERRWIGSTNQRMHFLSDRYRADDPLVAFSCRNRGLCPSCAGRRKAAQAAHLVDCILPSVPIRRFVLSSLRAIALGCDEARGATGACAHPREDGHPRRGSCRRIKCPTTK